MKNKLIGILCLLLISQAYSQTLELDGGTVVFGQEKVIVSLPRDLERDNDLNFVNAMRFSDGYIWLTHSQGMHGGSEHGVRRYSPDNGVTWLETDMYVEGQTSVELSDGSVLALRGWDDNQYNNHYNRLSIYSWPLDRMGESMFVVQPNLYFSIASSMYIRRSVIRLDDGKMLASGYGRRLGEDKDYTFCIQSLNNGASWSYLSAIAHDANNSFDEGYNEPCLVELNDGSILSLMRTGMESPLMQCKSIDGGASWSSPIQIADTGVDPTARVLADGTLVAASGRPGVYMLVDFTGTGDNWQEVEIYDGSGSSYTSIVEVEPNKIMLLYDKSDFSDYSLLPSGVTENMIVGQYIDIIPELLLLEGDANRDGVVSAGDYASVQANFGMTGEAGLIGDANGDGVVSAGDYASVQANFGNVASTTASIPEPLTMSLLFSGAVILLAPSRKQNLKKNSHG